MVPFTRLKNSLGPPLRWRGGINILLSRVAWMTSTKSSKTTKSESKGSTSFSSIPSAGWIALVVVGVGLLFLLSSSTPAPVAEVPVVPVAPTVPTTPTVPTSPTLPSNLYTLSISPESPKAGDDVTVTAVVKSGYEDMSGVFPFELGARQFGNWQTQSCEDSPCTLTLTSVSTGNLEYRAIRFVDEGGSLQQLLDGQYSTTVQSTGQTGDTLGPKVVVFFEPAKPKDGVDVEVTASVEDISSVTKVEIYVDDVLRKTCPQKVKIALCKVTVSDLEVGSHTFYAKAWDTYNNLTTSAEDTFVVESS